MSRNEKIEAKQKPKLENNELAKKIQDAFQNELHETVELNDILYALDHPEKKGVTNTFTTIKLNYDTYLIRINGEPWPPYNREYEKKALAVLKQNGFNTGVLYDGDGFQICRQINKEICFSEILKSNQSETIIKAIKLIAKEMARYHKILIKNHIDYPIADMIQKVIKQINKNFLNNPPIELQKIMLACNKILRVLNYSKTAHRFSHNDLFANSVYVDLKKEKVAIVDWEYSGNAHELNDLSKLSSRLPSEIVELLTKFYYCEMSGAKDTRMPENLKLEVQFISFLHKFLDIGWGIKSENVQQFNDPINILCLEIEGFSGELNKLHQATVSSNPVTSFVRNHPYLVTAGLFALTGTAYALYQNTTGETFDIQNTPFPT